MENSQLSIHGLSVAHQELAMWSRCLFKLDVPTVGHLRALHSLHRSFLSVMDRSSVANDDDDKANSSPDDLTSRLDHSFIQKDLTLTHEDGTVRVLSTANFAKIHQLAAQNGHRKRMGSIHDPHNENKVLVLYTGGTVGMKCFNGVYSPEPHYLPMALRELPPLNDHDYIDSHYSDVAIKPFCLPPVRGQTKRVVYTVTEFDPILDSSDMTFDDWIGIANHIKASYTAYDGFVILHGTDTLAYTASALSFMLENLGKPVVITGAQIPVAEVRSDGRENLIGALITAGYLDIPEVCVYFNNKLLRGNRTIKCDNSGLDAFSSPNLHPLAQMDVINYESIFRSSEIAPLNVHDVMCRDVSVLRIFPSIPITSVQAILQSPSIRGVVLETYGTGNIPLRRLDIIEELRSAVERGCLILNVSECNKGHVIAYYETGKILSDIGVIPGADMTVVAALTKLAYVLAKKCSLDEMKKMLQQNLRGELTVSHSEKLNQLDIIPRLAKFLHITSSREARLLREALFPPLVCHAAKMNDTELLKSLNLSGANFSNPDYSSRTALHVAASNGHVEAANLLLRNGVSVHVKDSENENALQAAVRSKNLETIGALRKAGGHLIATNVRIGTELCMAASQEDIELLKAWKLAGASLNQSDYGGRTALHVAVERGVVSVVDWLCDNGADPYARDNSGRTPEDESIAASDAIQNAITRAKKLNERPPEAPKFEI
ncbi:Asparaginase [Aphelenchoides besseyi]|nr:Asparaginase [Aphelenchoides besseyi]